MEKQNDKPLSMREKASLLILVSLTQMIIRVLNFADFRLELESDMKELKNLIKGI